MNQMREFVVEVKQLCKDFSDQRDRPYMGDVHAALDGLYEQWQAAQSAAVPVHDGNYADGVLYKILDDLYARGWADRQKGRDYDPRGTVEWQAVLDIFARAAVPEHIRSIKIPTDAMEQEFQKHYRRGYEAGKSDAVPVVGDVVAWRCKDYADGWILYHDKEIAENYQSQTGCLMTPLIVKPTTSITAAELSELCERVISAQGFTDAKLLNLMKRALP